MAYTNQSEDFYCMVQREFVKVWQWDISSNDLDSKAGLGTVKFTSIFN